MNLLKQIIIILATLLITAGSLLFSFLVFQVLSAGQAGLPLWLAAQINPLIESDWTTRLTVGGIFLGVFFIGAVLLYIELHLFFFAQRRFLISQDKLGKVEITRKCLRKFVNYEAKLFGGISASASQIVRKKDGLHVKSYITIDSEAKLSEIGQNLQNQIKDSLEKNFGLLVSEVIVQAKIKPSARKIV